MPWIRALPERVAFGSLPTELGDVKICLKASFCLVSKYGYAKWMRQITHGYNECTSKQPPPGILWVIRIVLIEEKRPLIAWYLEVAATKAFSYSETILIDMFGMKKHYSLVISPV
jgi:hypothetical protein